VIVPETLQRFYILALLAKITLEIKFCGVEEEEVDGGMETLMHGGIFDELFCA